MEELLKILLKKLTKGKTRFVIKILYKIERLKFNIIYQNFHTLKFFEITQLFA